MLTTGKFLRGRRLLLAAAVAVAGWVVLPASAQASICGNGILEGAEACDPPPGNLVGGDGCSPFCTIEACGNGITEIGEQCDPGTGVFSPFGTPSQANNNSATCTYNCTISSCGDNFVNGAAIPPEDCDAGATNTNGCNGNTGLLAKRCKFASCTDGYLNTAHIQYGHAEQCDDGNGANNDACDNNCTPPGCPNGIVNTGEGCDDGNTVSGDGCDNNCTGTGCGNGFSSPSEQCDQSLLVDPYPPTSGDGCSATCMNEVCGNGIVDAPVENCDPPFPNICNASCRYLSCGDGVIEAPEQCDPGPGYATGDPLIASNSSATCDFNCKLTVCGNSYTNGLAGEYCDPHSVGGTIANPVFGVACDAACRFTQCGNAITNTTEQCDPAFNFPAIGPGATTTVANTSNGICDVDCTNKVCGDNFTNTVGGEECDPPGLGLLCDTSCQSIQCGNGTKESNEACDTGCGNSGNPFVSNCASPTCAINCKLPGCGNGITEGFLGEFCDDGNLIDGDLQIPTANTCDSNCTFMACGNGKKTAGENCDGTPGCTNFPLCQDTICGNGVVSTMVGLEQCDDGPGAAATVQADGCTTACKLDPDRDGLLNPIDECNAIKYTIPAAATPDQNPGKASLKLSGLNVTGKNGMTFRGEFNPDRKKVCSGDPLNLTTCAVDADCAVAGGICGPSNPNKTGVTIQLKNGSNVLYALNVAGDNQAPGGEYIRNSPTPACGNRLDGWSKRSSTSGKITFTYSNRSGQMPIAADLVPYGVDGTCSGSAKGLRSLQLVYDAAKAKWTYNATVSNTTLDLPPTIAGTPAMVQNKLQLEVSLGFGSLNSPGSVGQCFDNQYRGSLAGGTGPVTGCTVRSVGVAPAAVSCK